MATKFDPLTIFLKSHAEHAVTLSFAKIEDLVGPLPKSARDYDPYWNESPTHTITHAWLRACYVRESVSRSAGILKLRKAPTEAARIRKWLGVADSGT
jgi:hypothetical protein